MNNLLYANSSGLAVQTATGAVVALDNTLADNAETGLAIETTGDQGSVIVKNNIVWGNANNIDVTAEYATTVEVTYPDIGMGGGQPPYGGIGNINEDPLFVDPTTANYLLGVGSPCIDAGDPDPSQNDPDGTRNDMGYTGGGYGFNTYVGGGEELYEEGMSLSFDTITRPGRTAIEKLTGFPAEGFPNITLEFLTEPIYYSVSTTAEFGTVQICIDLVMDLEPFEDFIVLYYYEDDELTEIPGSYVQGTEICADNVTHFCPIVAAIPDTDLDGAYDHEDNCPSKFNPDQMDSNGNGIGDACESAVWGAASTIGGASGRGSQACNYSIVVLLPTVLILGMRRKKQG